MVIGMTIEQSPVTKPVSAAFVRLAAVSSLSAALLAAAGWIPTRSLAGDAGVSAMLVGIAVAWVGALCGLMCPTCFGGRTAASFAWANLSGIAVRFLVTLALAAGLRFSGMVAPRPFLVWVGIAQFILLAVDTIGLVHAARAMRTHKAAK